MSNYIRSTKLYASCPICAHKLCKGDTGSTVEIFCPRCSHVVRAEFMDKKVDIQKFLSGYSCEGKYDKKKLKWCLINGYCHFYLMNKNNSEYRDKVLELLSNVFEW